MRPINSFSDKVYLVEDNPDNADLVVDMLSGDFDVTHFVSALDLLDFLEKSESVAPAVFILDISLPGMDGVDLLKALKEDEEYNRIPSLALTAHAMKDDKRKFLDAGFDAYVSKPIVDEEALISEVKRLANSS